MAIYLKITDGVVSNIVDCDSVFAAENHLIQSDSDSVAIGDSFENGVFIKRDETEEFWQNVRKQRNLLLLDSDKYVYPDIWQSLTTEEQQSLSVYRQELRDIPQKNNNPRLIKWPTNWK